MNFIHCVVLNSNRRRIHSTATLQPELRRYRKLLSAEGSFLVDLDPYQLRVMGAPRYAALGLKRNGQAIALAMLAWGMLESEISWDELGQQHHGMMRALGRTGSEFKRAMLPPALPWLGISLAPSFYDPSPPMLVDQAVAVLSAVGLILLNQAHETGSSLNEPVSFAP